MILENVQPVEVFRYFEEICAIPHGSQNVEQISNYLVDFAKEHQLKYRQDDSLNVIIWKDATKGHENEKTVILQGHMDMVAVKETGCSKDMEKEGLDLVIDGDYIKAKQTSLGGDDGIAVAYALAVLASDTIEHPALEVVITVDEEIGMLGAVALDTSDLHGAVMLNMDSEEEGILTAGCAGGALVEGYIPLEKSDITGYAVTIQIDGLTGGHSGVDIIFQRANANIIAGRILSMLSKEVQYGLCDINGGEKDNVITMNNTMHMTVEKEDIENFKNTMAKLTNEICSEYEKTDANLSITYEISENIITQKAFTQAVTTKIVMAMVMEPYGVQKMSNDIQGLVQTSDNLGIVRTLDDSVKLAYSVRSSVASEKEWLIDKIVDFIEFLGGACEISGRYPSWEYQRESSLRDMMVREYTKIYGEAPVVNTIHAGVECGVIADKIAGLDCISFGPDILEVHSVRERLNIASVERTWKFLLAVLAHMSEV